MEYTNTFFLQLLHSLIKIEYETVFLIILLFPLFYSLLCAFRNDNRTQQYLKLIFIALQSTGNLSVCSLYQFLNVKMLSINILKEWFSFAMFWCSKWHCFIPSPWQPKLNYSMHNLTVERKFVVIQTFSEMDSFICHIKNHCRKNIKCNWCAKVFFFQLNKIATLLTSCHK